MPKYLVNDDGTIGAWNHVETASLEHKMGIRGSATCTLNFNAAKGFLIGEENRGLAGMFHMMNVERLTVGLQGLGFAEIASQNALAYATERLQSKAPGGRVLPDKPADPILHQPEVQRQLLRMRSQIEGARALGVFASFNVDVMEKSTDENAASDASHTVALLTPVIKAFFSDLGLESTISAQQIYGGHGYISEHGMEQLVRDCRITQIYEGTNEVQALDLVSRKLTGETGEFADRFLSAMASDLGASAGDPLVDPALEALERLMRTTTWLREQLENNRAVACGAAYPYLRLFALTVIAGVWARIAVSIRDASGAFYDVKRKVARFYMDQVLPETVSLAATIVGGAGALADFDARDFGGQP